MVTNKIAAAKKKYFRDQYENCSGNQNEKWRFVKQILNKNSSNEDNLNTKLRNHDGSLLEDQNEILNYFNNFFATIGNTLAEKLPPPATDFKSDLIFYPHLIYGVEFWGNAADTNLREIKFIQKIHKE